MPEILPAITMNDVVTTIAAALSAYVFPYLSKREKDFEQKQLMQYQELTKQNECLKQQLAEVTDRLLSIVEKQHG